MSKKKQKSYRQERDERFVFDDLNDDRFAYYGNDSDEDDEDELFDIERWRNDLFERG